MRFLDGFKRAFHLPFRPAEGDVEEELAFHLEERTRELVEQGLDRGAALAEARRRFGDAAAIRRESSAIQRRLAGRRRRAEVARSLVHDVRVAVRALTRAPAFTSIAVVMLALGIGANTAVFSVLDQVILAPLPYDEPDRLVRIYNSFEEAPSGRTFLAALDFIDFREAAAFASAGALNNYREIGRDLTGDGPPRRIRTLPVTAGYFETYRATPLLGRTFSRDEEAPDLRLVVLSHRLWTAHSGGDPDIVGKDLVLDGERYTVIGVMRPTFADIVGGDVAAWTPQSLRPGPGISRTSHFLSAVARLAPGVTVAQAQAQLDAIYAGLAEQFPDNYKGRHVHVVPLHEAVVRASETMLFVLMGAASLVLLIACVNVANLLLARGVARAKETAVRTALGAGRLRIVRERVTESFLVALAGGAAGTIAALVGVRALLGLSPGSLARAESVRFDAGVLGFALLASVVTALLFGAAPALHAARVDPNESLRDGTRGNTGGPGSRRLTGALVAVQLSLALVLSVGAGLLIKSFVRLQRVDLGIDVTDVATFEVHLPPSRYPEPDDRVRFHDALLARLRALPGVEHAGATSWLPANGSYHHWGLSVQDATTGEWEWSGGQTRVVEGDFFDVFGIRVVAGSGFRRELRSDDTRAAVLSETVVAQRFVGRDPIGEHVWTGGTEFVVVGVVADAAYDARGATMGLVYTSHGDFADDRNWSLTYAVRSQRSLGDLVATARRELAAIDPALVLYQPRSMQQVLARHRARETFTLSLMGIFAAVAMSLAAIGVYGVLSYAVNQRLGEFGIRMALGARAGDIRALVARQSLVVAGTGAAIGLPAGLALASFLESLVFEVNVRDPLVYATVAAVLGVVVVVAAAVPARRATRVEPLEVLRAE